MAIPRPFGTPFADAVRHYLQTNQLKQSQLTGEIVSDLAQRFYDHYQALHKKKRKEPEGWEAELPIYEAYPRKIARDDALRAIRGALQKSTCEVLLEASRSYARCVDRWPASYRFHEGRDLVPHPATWFNRGSYLDDPKEWLPPGYAQREDDRPPARLGAQAGTPEPEGWQDHVKDHEDLAIHSSRNWETINPYYQKQIAKLCTQ